jgi:hypothetical protein
MRSDRLHSAVVFAVIFVCVFVLHARMLQLPYFWDEAGYYIPAARDLLLTGSVIPHTTVSNAHPPLVLAWVALWWKIIGYAPVVTRSAMLVVAAFSLLGVFRLAARVANIEVAIASTLCVGLYPVFFAQSSLAQVDLAAAGLTFWGLAAYLEGRPLRSAVWFALAALAKETAILTPAALMGHDVLAALLGRWRPGKLAWPWASRLRKSVFAIGEGNAAPPSLKCTFLLLISVLPLAAWYTYHYLHTGYVFGNPEFFRYNVAATLNVRRFLLALGLRLWQVFGYLHLWVLTLAMFLALLLSPLKVADSERPRIAIAIQLIFLAIVIAYLIAMALVGGAVLARYMLPATPLTIIVAVSTLWRRVRWWQVSIGIVALAFVAGWFWNPPYGFAPEDNLAYRDYIELHEDGERFLEARYPMARVLTAWPASDELTRPWLGYITRPVQVVRIENFSLDEVLSAADFRSNFEIALVFSTKYEPAHSYFERWTRWQDLKARFFGFHRDLPAAVAANLLGGHIVFSEARKGQWIAVIALDRVEDAALRAPMWHNHVPE